MGGKSLQSVMLLCSEKWEQGTFSGQGSSVGGSGAAARGCVLPGSIPTSFLLLPGISASRCCAGPLFPTQMAAAVRDAQPCSACMLPESQSGMPVLGIPIRVGTRVSTHRTHGPNPTVPCVPGHGRRGNPGLGIRGVWKNRTGEGGERQLRGEHVGAVMALGSRDFWRR